MEIRGGNVAFITCELRLLTVVVEGTPVLRLFSGVTDTLWKLTSMDLVLRMETDLPVMMNGVVLLNTGGLRSLAMAVVLSFSQS